MLLGFLLMFRPAQHLADVGLQVETLREIGLDDSLRNRFADILPRLLIAGSVDSLNDLQNVPQRSPKTGQ